MTQRHAAEGATYRVGLIGNCCTHGEFVAAALKEEPRARIVTAFENDPRRAPALAEATGCALTESPDAIVDDPAIDIVALACSPHEKADWCERAARAGKHIFLNKPMCESLDAARRIQRVIDDTGVKLVHDITVFRFHPIGAKLLDAVRAGTYGPPLSYMSSWGMTFSPDFPLATVWPERLDPPAETGGGELTNLGCYAIDYMVALWGAPVRVQAKLMRRWQPYAAAGVESFGQIIADYGDFYAVLAAGKQPIAGRPTMDVAAALKPEAWHSVIEIRFEAHNITALPFADTVFVDGRPIAAAAFLDGHETRSPFVQLVDAIETGAGPESDAATACLGVEVLMAAYRSAQADGAPVALPLDDGTNPLVAPD